MLLETLDIKKNDVVIFSRNIFDWEKNFKVIYKDDPKKVPHKISFKEVCRFVNEFTPKNIIVYRLLTNIKDFEIYPSKYGFYLSINNITELIFSDPVFAIKELEDYSEAINYYNLRFRIQQVGLTTLNRKGNLPNYAEIYNIDLEATEARFQNDMAFAQAIFVFAGKESGEREKLQGKESVKKVFPKKMKPEEQKSAAKLVTEKSSHHEINKVPQIIKKEAVKRAVKKDDELVKGKLIKHDISEDENFDYNQIIRINVKGTAGLKKGMSKSKNEKPELASNESGDKVELIPRLIKHNGGTHKTFGSILKSANASEVLDKTSETSDKEKPSMIIDIFKSSSSLKNYLTGRENKKIVLKMNKK